MIHKLVDQMLARLLCSAIGHLAAIKSQNDLDILASHESGRYWVDLNDIETEGKWETALTGNASFINWEIPEPTNGPDEDCASIINRNMRDTICTAKFHFICEI